MSIVATVLSGNSEAVVAEALSSAKAFVDKVLLIDTGITDGTRRVAEGILGERLAVEEFRWCDDFGQARNFALEAAGTRQGAMWAMTLDTDERLEFLGYRSREELLVALESDPEVLVWLVMEKGGKYAKERFVRVGGRVAGVGDRESGVRWVGRVHEALVGARPGEAKVLPGVLFWEVPKSAEAHRAKLERDLVVLREETRDKPDDPR